MNRLLCLLLLLAGCGGTDVAVRELLACEAAAIRSGFDAAPDTGLAPVPSRCYSGLSDVRVAVVDRPKFEEVCRREACLDDLSNRPCFWGCYTRLREPLPDWLFVEDEAPLLVVLDFAPGTVVMHEAVHYLDECAYGTSSPGHSDARLWSVGGVLGKMNETWETVCQVPGDMPYWEVSHDDYCATAR